MRYIKQWVEVGGISYPEYGNDELTAEEEDYLFPELTSEEAKFSQAYTSANNSLQSAKYQLTKLADKKDKTLSAEHRLQLLNKFLDNALAAINQMKEMH